MTVLAPLMQQLAPLDDAERERYNRHLILPSIGVEGQRRLKSARVLVIGAGGLGSPVLLYLAAAGVGTIGIIDFDRVDQSNLQRQIIHGQSDVGAYKTDSARDSIRAVNDTISVELHRTELASDNAVRLFERYDLVVDGTDNFSTRYLISDAAEISNKPCIWGAIHQFEGHVTVFWSGAPDGRRITYRDIFPSPPPRPLEQSCSEGGVLGVLCASIGSIMATEVVKLITGIGDSLLGRLLVYDALALRFDTLTIEADACRKPITRMDAGAFRSTAADDANTVTPDEVGQALHSGTAVLIDVREPFEFDGGHIDTAESVPLSLIEAKQWDNHIPVGRNIILYCQTGRRSAIAVAHLRTAGYTSVTHLRGGYTRWTHDHSLASAASTNQTKHTSKESAAHR